MTELAELVQVLVDWVTAGVLTATREGKISRTTRAFFTTAPILHDSGSTWPQQYEERQTWDQYDLSRVIEDLLKTKQDDLEESVKAIAQHYELSVDRVRSHLRAFLERLGWRAAKEGVVSDPSVAAARFIHEISDGPLNWRGLVFLEGITTKEEHIKVGDGILLRRPRPEDLSFEYPADRPVLRSPEELFSVPDSVLEIVREVTKAPENEGRRIVNALCLYDLAGVRIVRQSYVSDSAFRPHHTSSPLAAGSKAPYSYQLTAANEPSLEKFVASLPTNLPTKPTGTHSGKHWLGLKFYFRALFTATDDEERIAMAVASLESLLTIGFRTEVAFRLGQRTAVLLQFAGLDASAVFADMQTAYDIRSRYAHGEQPKGQKLTPDLCRRVLNYARLVVVKMMDVEPEDREAFGKRLDSCLLDSTLLNRLRQEIPGGMWEFVRPFPATL